MSATPDVAARWKRRAVELASVPVSLSVETIDDLAQAISTMIRQIPIPVEISDIDLVAKTVLSEAVEIALNAANSIDVIGGGDATRGFVSSVDPISGNFTVKDGSGRVVSVTGPPPVMTPAEARLACTTNVYATYAPFLYIPTDPGLRWFGSSQTMNANQWNPLTFYTGFYLNGNLVPFTYFGAQEVWLEHLSASTLGFIGFKTSFGNPMPDIGTEMLDLGLAGWIQKPPANLTVNPVAPAYDPVISQPVGATRYSIAYAPSIGGVVTPTWQVWDLVTGFALANQATMSTNIGVRAPTMAEAISSVYYGRWYNNAYVDLGRKS